jgi:16S rRNA (adenine1518-N6/adenine1519-N6)-dimethyltransferase
LEIHPGDKVLEIGPGLGFLTEFLSMSGGNITAVELDHECVDDLNRRAFKNVSITHGDFLQYDIGTVGNTVKIVGNVPYQITTPIIAHILGEIGEPQPWLNKVERVVLTVQYEVAQRFVAEAGSEHYSQITLLTNYFTRAKLLRKIGPEHFFPAPEVTSAVVEFITLKEPPIKCKDVKMLRKVIKAGFSQRRKMLKNNYGFLHADPKELAAAFEHAHINPQTRAETLTLEQFARLSDTLLEIDHHHRDHG